MESFQETLGKLSYIIFIIFTFNALKEVALRNQIEYYSRAQLHSIKKFFL